MKGSDLLESFNAGFKPTVKFKNTENYELESFDDGMLAKLETIRVYDNENIICKFNFSDSEDYNKPLEQASWYGKNNELVRWSETPYYPKDKIVDVWIGYGEINVFDVVDDNIAFADYKQSHSNLNYVNWLEDQYTNLKLK